MVKTRKTRKSVEDDVVEKDEAVEEPIVDIAPPPYVPKHIPAKEIPKPPPPKEFVAILEGATTLSLAGIKFMRNVPTKVPMAHRKLFQSHGWFRVIV